MSHLIISEIFMCDVCKAEGLDWHFHNGEKDTLHTGRLYRVYVGQVAKVRLCQIHAVQLFNLGEMRFLRENLALAREVSEKKSAFLE